MTSYIQPPPDSTGKKIELNRVQNPDGVDTYRQRIDIPVEIDAEGETMDAILLELKLTNWLLARIMQAAVMGTTALDLNALRNEIKTLQFTS